MMRWARGAWSRRGSLLTLALMTAVVIAGAVVVVGFAHAARTSWLLAAPLLLLAVVAVPALGAELVATRREEIGLARLRGIRGLRLWLFLLSEPLLAILLGLVVGIAAGAALTVVSASAWLGKSADPLTADTLILALSITAVGLVVVSLGAGAALREPLGTQVATRRRPRPATTVAVFAAILLIVGAAVAAYRAHLDNTVRADPLVLLGPALMGLALGQVAVWVLRILARSAPASGLGAFLAQRRLLRAEDLITPLRLVIAAGIIGTLALSAAGAVDDWSAEQARIATGGPEVIDATELGAFGAIQATRRVDPTGEHLMAVALYPSPDQLNERRALVDTERFAAVSGDFFDDSVAHEAAKQIPELAGGTEAPVGVGNRLEIGVEALRSAGFGLPERQGDAPSGTYGISVDVNYLTADNRASSATKDIPLAQQGARADVMVRLDGCEGGCQITSLSVQRLGAGGWQVFDPQPFLVAFDRLQFGGADLLKSDWQPVKSELASILSDRWIPGRLKRLLKRTRVVQAHPDFLGVSPFANFSPTTLELRESRSPIAVLSAGHASVTSGGKGEAQAADTVLDLGGDSRQVDTRQEVEALPFVGETGTLMDIHAASVGVGATPPSAVVRIVADADTPATMITRLEASTGTKVRTLEQERKTLIASSGAAQSRGYALMAGACALVALIALAAGVARHRRDYRRDVAALRTLGVGVGTVRSAGRTELAVLALLVAVAVTAGGWLSVRLLLGGLPLLTLPPAAVPFDVQPTWWPLVVPAVLAAIAVAAVGGRARAVSLARTRPAMLREEDN